jgi:stearoyl-CoA desaturase (delta-9 desaturase)
MIISSHAGSFLLLYTGISLGALAWGAGLYLIRMLATTAIYHRLLTHRAYQAPRLVLWIGCLLASSSAQMGPSWWKAHHLAHHLATDRPGDPHSPILGGGSLRSFLWSQGGWLLSPAMFPERLPADVENDPVLRFIDRFHFLPVVALGTLSYRCGGLEYLGAFFLSTTLLFHGVQTVNSLTHLIGHRPFVTDDNSRNNAFVALITLGEGWHNLHHAFQYSCRQGITIADGEVRQLPDPTYAFIRFLSWLGLAWGLQLPNDDLLRSRSREDPKNLIRNLSPG